MDFASKIKNKYILNRKIEKHASNESQECLKSLNNLSKEFISNTSNLLLIEGKILLKEALKTKCVQIEKIFNTEDQNDWLLDNMAQSQNQQQHHEISHGLMDSISGVKTSQGVLAFARYKPENLDLKDSLPFTVILDRVKDPGNMGAVIRTAAGVGCDLVLVTKGSVNPWSPKVLRSAMGGHFHVNVRDRVGYEEIKEKYLSKSTRILLADAKESKTSIDYGDLTFNREDRVTLVVGNEATGISDYFFEMTKEMDGVCSVKVPLAKSVESLNCSIAFAVIAYEIRRLLNKK